MNYYVYYCYYYGENQGIEAFVNKEDACQFIEKCPKSCCRVIYGKELKILSEQVAPKVELE